MLRALMISLCLLGLTSFLQGQGADSLVQKLEQPALPETERVDVLNILARDIAYTDPFRAIVYAQEAMERSEKLHYDKGIAYANRNLAGAYSYFGSFYLTSEKINRALDLFEEMKDSAGIASCYISLGHMYHRLHQHEEELNYHQKAYAIFLRSGIAERIGVTGNNLAEAYLDNQQYSLSLEMAREAARINDSLQNRPVLSSVYKIMGKVFMATHQTDSAVLYFEKCLAISDQLGPGSQKIASIESMIDLADAYSLQNRHDDELAVLKKASAYVKMNKMTDYVPAVYTKLIRACVMQNRNAEARAVVNEYIATRDSLQKQQWDDKARLTMGFMQLNEVERKNTELAQANTLQAQRIHDRNILTLISFAFSLVLLVLLLLFVRNMKRLRRVNREITAQDQTIREQNRKLEELNQTKDKFFSVVTHDIKAPLNALWTFSRLFEENVQHLDRSKIMLLSRELNTQVEATTKMTDNLILWAKLQMKDFSVNPESCNLEEIVQEIKTVYDEIAAGKSVRIEVALSHTQWPWCDPNHLRFILRNLVNNAIKYSPVNSYIRISSEERNGMLLICVKDQGAGIPETVKEQILQGHAVTSKTGTSGETGTGMGLKLCSEFVKLNKGSLEMMPAGSDGAMICVQLPVSGQ